jgi:hypothetical protein
MKHGDYERIRRYLITSIRWAGSLPLTPGLTAVPSCVLCLGAGDNTVDLLKPRFTLYLSYTRLETILEGRPTCI